MKADSNQGPGGVRTPHRRAMLLVALAALLGGLIAYEFGALAGFESGSADLRFSMRGAKPPSDVVVVGVDSKTLNALQLRWPFPRSLDARAIDVLRADHARTIVYDVQFTQPTAPKEDSALYESIARARNVILATSEIGPRGTTNVLGGDSNLAAAHTRAGAAVLWANSSGVIQKYPYAVGGLKTLAVAAAENASGRSISSRAFDHGSAWIDFRGPNHTIPSTSFSDLVDGKVSRSSIAGKVVVVGATAPVLQDVHATSTTSSAGMAGPEVQANAIWTALHGNPLRAAPGWLAILTIILGALAVPLLCLRLHAPKAFAIGLLTAAVYALVAQLAFDANWILVVTYPLASLALGALGALIVSYALESWERQLAQRYGATLEAEVRERTSELSQAAIELHATQLEAIHHLAQAAEMRDEDTGQHIERISRICELLALRLGMPAVEAERLGIASVLHDVGKIGIPDRILLKPGPLNAKEWEIMKTHTTAATSLLSDSNSALIKEAATIARTHHERWDGQGYPAGLRGEEIPLAGRICAICDVFDALSSRRPYKESWAFDRVIKEITNQRGTHFDPDVVDAFLTLMPELERAHANASNQTGRPALGSHDLRAHRNPGVDPGARNASDGSRRTAAPAWD